MQLAVFSDIHDNLKTLQHLLAILQQMPPEAAIFCGDFNAPFVVKMLAEKLPCPLHAVFGNNDGDRFNQLRQAHVNHKLTLHGEYADITIDNHRIAMTHYEFYAQALARTQDYRAVFFGHTHRFAQQMIGTTLLLNPGDLLGLHHTPQFCWVDLATHSVTPQQLDV